jgi:ABC-2 type transport system ATP-binding protein
VKQRQLNGEPVAPPTLYQFTVTGYSEFQKAGIPSTPCYTEHPRKMTATATSTPALRVHGLRKAYKDVVAVDGLDLEVRTGECFGLLGPNGAGKTTTIEICEGLLPADSGSVEVLGRRWESDADDLRELLGIQLQDTQLSEKLTVEETLTLFQSFYRNARDIDDVIDVVELGEKRSSRVGTLSGGQKQRLAVACALVGNPQLLFLDEPTTGLDPQSRRQMWDLIAQFQAEGKTIVLTTHYMEEAERLCDRVAIVDHGHLIALGTPRELMDSIDVSHLPPPEPRKTTATLEDVFVSLTGRTLRDE